MRYGVCAIAILLWWLALLQTDSLAMTDQSGSVQIRRQDVQSSDQPTGLFGGIRPDGTFVFRLSKDRGIRFYRLASNVRLSGFPAGLSLQQLPEGTPIRLTVEEYRIRAVELLGGQP
jgi:hypothetical protein